MEENIKLLRSYWDIYNTFPTYRKIASLCGFSSTNSAYKLVKKLESLMIIAKNPDGKFVFPPSTYCVEGVVGASFPSVAYNEDIDEIRIDEFLIENKNASYLLKVLGDSMLDAGILDGDYVIADRSKEAHHGDIVVACIDGSYTLKYLEKKHSKIFLRSGNKEYPSLFPYNELIVEAVVVSVIRKL